MGGGLGGVKIRVWCISVALYAVMYCTVRLLLSEKV